ncbi:hypothetical protein PSN45_002324 [Yamadazyma tenuis]|uniref:Nucleotide-diphospho-sugar transferase n=1 Tax=Candida tenuis (strain ATCC 10573 / BCRC 21748 / CBS 615 / JCM 9827 / NBRC 10315 / NRRL Y-1498 / VKM Y-70) TaxID=590646 RepID=G3BEQ6_CANTC|nr:nucleotide-diphospho-sugar transferase [Yamadazyma tenuis ATCC 10573]EGV59951.1 nucleotide-diphospho-sugar transferase [Yamadazyma tenuis ATCC 10573]WEJ94824.1 hypothetical protein PSN45_002324 [Yamadazyma tenuis]
MTKVPTVSSIKGAKMVVLVAAAVVLAVYWLAGDIRQLVDKSVGEVRGVIAGGGGVFGDGQGAEMVKEVAEVQGLEHTSSDRYPGPVSGISQLNKRDQNRAGKEKAAMVLVIVSLEDARLALETIQHYQERFNNKFNYDWVLVAIGSVLSDRSQDFAAVAGNVRLIELRGGRLQTSPSANNVKNKGERVEQYPAKFKTRSNIRQKKLARMMLGPIFEVGDLWDDYDFYWKVPVGSSLGCDVNYDVFEFMRQNQIAYGWSLIHQDYQGTQPELISEFQSFVDASGGAVNPENLQFMLDETKDSTKDWHYKGCSFHPEFEIVDLNFFRTSEYQKMREFIEDKGLLFYRGWRDPAIRTLLTSTLLHSQQIHFFDDLAVEHPSYGLSNCPADENVYLSNRCSCDPFKKSERFVSANLRKDYDTMHNHECVTHWYRSRGESNMLDPDRAQAPAEPSVDGPTFEDLFS